MKLLRRYNNAKIEEVEGWDTTSKRSEIDINDTKNGFFFDIEFGKNPKISIWKTNSSGDPEKSIFSARIGKNSIKINGLQSIEIQQ